MATTSVPWTDELVEAAGIKLHIIKGGTGQPLLLLHDELGHPGWLRYHAALAQHYTLYMPLHPGCGQSEGLDWVMNMRDLACWYLDALDELGLGQVPVISGSLGGWLAAEMATMCPQQFKRLVLVGAMGLDPGADGDPQGLCLLCGDRDQSEHEQEEGSQFEFHNQRR